MDLTEEPPSSNLLPQNLQNLDVNTLSPLTPEIISRQATINFGTIGHVAHGKSTVVRAISGVQTVRFKNEKERNITIKLGYANAKIYRCQNEKCPTPQCYASYGSAKEDEPNCLVPGCGSKMKLLRHISFVDCPGHDILMATMLNGAAVMDAALLLIAGNEPCPQPQTSEHLAAVEIMKLKHIIILQNKIELIKHSQAEAQYEQIKEFIAGTAAQFAPIIPISAVLKYNIDVLAEYICTQIPVPVRDFTGNPQMIVIRSFDVNKPGDAGETVKGGVVGGSILKGVLKVGKEVEIRPGITRRNPKGGFIIRPIRSTIVSLFAEQNNLQFAVPGGLIGVGTKIDPSLTRADRLVGHVLGYPDFLPDILVQLELKFYLLRRLLGVKSKDRTKGSKVETLKTGEFLMINVGSTSVGGQVKSTKQDKAKLTLMSPVCAQIGDKVALSRRIEKHWRLIGWAEIVRGEAGTLTYDWTD